MGRALEKCAWAEHDRHLASTFYAFYANIRAQAWIKPFPKIQAPSPKKNGGAARALGGYWA